jgi:hypothetical protein
MEDVLAVSTRPYDPRRPQVWLDETSRQLLAEVNPPRPVAPGRPTRQDYEYQRGGVCNLFLMTEPLAGWRQVTVSDRRTRMDWAHSHQGAGRGPLPRCRADRAGPRQPQHPHAGVAVCGVRAGRGQAAGRSAGAALQAQAWQLVAHGRARVGRAGRPVPGPAAGRSGDPGAGGRGVAGDAQPGRSWVNWRFTTEDARIKLKHLYPAVQG